MSIDWKRLDSLKKAVDSDWVDAQWLCDNLKEAWLLLKELADEEPKNDEAKCIYCDEYIAYKRPHKPTCPYLRAKKMMEAKP